MKMGTDLGQLVHIGHFKQKVIQARIQSIMLEIGKTSKATRERQTDR